MIDWQQHRESLKMARKVEQAERVLSSVHPAKGLVINGDLSGLTGFRSHSWSDNDFEKWGALPSGRGVNAAVMACITKLMSAYPIAPLQVYDAETDEPIPNDPLQRLVDAPNSWQSGEDLRRVAIMFLAFGGNAYVVVTKSADRRGQTMNVYHDGHITIKGSSESPVDHYIYMKDTKHERRLELDEVIHLKWPVLDMSRPWMGQAPLVAVGREVGIDNEVSRVVYTVLKNDAAPKGVLIEKTDGSSEIVDPEQQRAMEREWSRNYGGDNRGNTPILTNMTYQRIALSLQELDLSALQAVPEARIAAAFLTDPIHAGLTAGMGAQTYDNRAGARRTFYEDAISQMWQSHAAAFTHRLLPNDGKRYFWFTTTDVIGLKADADALTVRVTTMWEKGLIPRSRALAILEVPTEDDAPDGYFYELTTPTATTPEPPAPAKSLQIKSAEPAQEDTERLAYFKAFDDVSEQAAERLQKALRRELARLLKKVLASHAKAATAPATKDRGDDEPFDLAAEQLAFVKATEAIRLELVEDQIIQALKEIEGDGWESVVSEFDELLQDATDASSFHIKGPLKTIYDDLRDVLRANREETVDSLEAIIRERFKMYSDSRVRLIARTTVTHNTGAAQRGVYDEMVTRGKGSFEWLDSPGGGGPHRHASMRGQRPDDDGMFTSPSGAKGRHPGSLGSAAQDCNCMCVLRWRPA